MQYTFATAAFIAIGPAVASAQPQFSWVGTLPGGSDSRVSAVSADGIYTVGWSSSPDGTRAYRRSHYHGIVSLGSMPAGGDTFATGVDSAGSTVVGWGFEEGAARPFQWTPGGGLAVLPLPAGDTWGRVFDISANGQWMAGQSGNGSRSFATRWSSGMPSHLEETAGTVNCSAASVNDAGTVAGYAEALNGSVFAMRWDAGQPVPLAQRSGETRSVALFVSETNVVLGGSENEATADAPLKWTGAQPPVLQQIPSNGAVGASIQTGNVSASAYGGRDYNVSPEAFFSGPLTGGAKTIGAYLAQASVSFSGLLDEVSGMSSTGTVVVGNGFHSDRREGWILRMPGAPSLCTADLGVQGGQVGQDGVLDNNDFIAFISLFFLIDPRADLGRQGGLPGSDGLFDNNDFVAFISDFFGGCP